MANLHRVHKTDKKYDSIIILLMWMRLILVHAVADNKQLIFVNMVWRHGDRSYIKSYPNDPYKNGSIWKNGLGELTNIGISQQYELGKFLRLRYNTILNNSYRPDEIYIRSTDSDRTIMSAQSNLAGLYPVTNDELWNGSHTSWHPVPVHVVPLEKDKLLRYPIKDCPKYTQTMDLIHKSKWFLDHERNYSNFYRYIQKNTGSTYPYNFRNIWEVEDNLFCLNSNGFPLPSWVKSSDLKTLKFLNSLDMGTMFTDVDYKYRNSISRMQGGVLIKEIIQNMLKHVNGTSTYRAVAYSAHDTTLAALLVALGNYDWVQPDYASCVMMELHKDPNGYFVEMLYRRHNGSMTNLKYYNCSSMSCPFDEFVKISQALIPDDHDKVCGKIHETANYYKTLCIVLGCISALLFIILALYIIVTLISSRKTKRLGYSYTPVETDADYGPI